jgi:hypothetical protein
MLQRLAPAATFDQIAQKVLFSRIESALEV